MTTDAGWSKVMLSAIVLAAGLSRRMGTAKLLLPLPDGRSVIRTTVEQVIRARDGEVDQVIVVLGQAADLIEQDLQGLPIRTVVNPHFAAGMSTSLKAGLQAVNSEVVGVMIFLGDQPLVAPAVIHQLVTAFRQSSKPIMIPLYGDMRGHPVLFSTSLFPELMQVEGDQGGRRVIAREPERVATVAFPADFGARDVDTWNDYELLRASINSGATPDREP